MAVSNMNLIRALVSQLREIQALACGGGDGGVQTKTIISPKFQISAIYLRFTLKIRIDLRLMVVIYQIIRGQLRLT